MATSRTTFALTPEDRAMMSAIRTAHGLPTDTAALRFALAQVTEDIDLGGIGAAAMDAERAYRRLGGLIANRKAFNESTAALIAANAGNECDCAAADAEVHAQFKARHNADSDEYVHIIPDTPRIVDGKRIALCGKAREARAYTTIDDDKPSVDALCPECVEAKSAPHIAKPGSLTETLCGLTGQEVVDIKSGDYEGICPACVSQA